MTTFVQLHLLTSYPPSNLNRDDLGRPKSAMLGSAPRLRVSSQSLKRAWRTSDVFAEEVSGEKIGTRTKEIGVRHVFEPLKEAGFSEDAAESAAKVIADVFGATKKKGKSPGETALIEQLVHLAPEEIESVDALVKTLIAEKRLEPTPDELVLLRQRPSAADIAMFGRMLASSPAFNVEASCQVAHAITVHRAVAEDDYFTAVDDLKTHDDDRGAAHVGEAEFGAGVYYLYLCIDRDLLVDNLQGDDALATKCIRGLLRAAALVAPGGKQASFASRSRASYIRVEKGTDQPRSLSMAFVKPTTNADVLGQAIERLTEQAERFDAVYGESDVKSRELNAVTGKGKFDDLLTFASGA